MGKKLSKHSGKQPLSKIDTKIVLKTVMVFDAILNCENKLGLLLPDEEIVQEATEDAKRYNVQISSKEIFDILDVFLLSGVIFSPRKGYNERFSAYKRHQEEINEFLNKNGRL